MSAIRIRRHGAVLRPQHARVIIRPFIPENAEQIRAIIRRALALTEEDVCEKLQAMHRDFAPRHLGIEAKLLQQYARVRAHIAAERPLSSAREQYIGALFSGEYALESAALFNPSIVPHPDQSDVPQGSLRFIMSLRATGEGHISSIEFRGGLVSADSAISFDDVSGFAMQPEVVLNPSYRKPTFTTKLREMSFARRGSCGANSSPRSEIA